MEHHKVFKINLNVMKGQQDPAQRHRDEVRNCLGTIQCHHALEISTGHQWAPLPDTLTGQEAPPGTGHH